MNSNLGSATDQMCVVEVLAAEVGVHIPLQHCFEPHDQLLVGETEHGPQSRVHTKYIAQFATVRSLLWLSRLFTFQISLNSINHPSRIPPLPFNNPLARLDRLDSGFDQQFR